MKTTIPFPLCALLALSAVGALVGGCSSTSGGSAGTSKAAAAAADPGKLSYQRTDKLDKVWLADGFDFTGYDAVLVETTEVDSSVKPKDDKESERLTLMQGGLSRDFLLAIELRKIFKTVTTKASDIPAETKALKLRSTVLKFSRGSSAARFGVGFGAGMPYVQVRVAMAEMGSNKPLFECELDEKADWFGAGYTGSQTLQAGAAMELAGDVAEFMSRVSNHRQIKYR